MRFLVDRCAGSRLAAWLRRQGHDVVDAREEGPDPGDSALLERAAKEGRILVTIDTDFGELLFLESKPHRGLVRLPGVPSKKRIQLMSEVITRHATELAEGAIITVRRGRIRISRSPQ